MSKSTRHLGFGNVNQVSVRFGIPASEVKDRFESGEWPAYRIGRHLVFDFDEIERIHAAKTATVSSGVAAS